MVLYIFYKIQQVLPNLHSKIHYWYSGVKRIYSNPCYVLP